MNLFKYFKIFEDYQFLNLDKFMDKNLYIHHFLKIL